MLTAVLYIVIIRYDIMIIGGCFFMRKSVNKKINILLGKQIAHRGLWDVYNPENSIGAYLRCIDRNIPIELDVHILKDKSLVVFHDDDTMRMTGKRIILKDANYDDVKDLKLKNTSYKIPKFSDILNLVDGQVLLDIEVKNDVKNFKICNELCKCLDNYKGEFIVKSFNPIYLLWFRIYRPNYVRGLLVSSLGWNVVGKILEYMLFNMWFNFLVKPDFVAFNYKNLPNKKVDRLRRKGMPILLFTVKKNDIINYTYDGYIYEDD